MGTQYEATNDRSIRFAFRSYYRTKVASDRIYKTLSFTEKIILLRQANGKKGKTEESRKFEKL